MINRAFLDHGTDVGEVNPLEETSLKNNIFRITAMSDSLGTHMKETAGLEIVDILEAQVPKRYGFRGGREKVVVTRPAQGPESNGIPGHDEVSVRI